MPPTHELPQTHRADVKPTFYEWRLLGRAGWNQGGVLMKSPQSLLSTGSMSSRGLAAPPTVTEGQVTGDGSMVLLQFDFNSLQVSGPRCENLSPVYFGSVSPGDGHRSASNPATAQCHQLITGTWIAGTFKRCLLTWNTLSDLVPPSKFPCGRPMTKERESPYVSGSEMTNIHSVIS